MQRPSLWWGFTQASAVLLLLVGLNAAPLAAAAEPLGPTGPLEYHPAPVAGTMSSAPYLRWLHPLPGATVPPSMRAEFGRPLLSGRDLWIGTSGEDALFRLERENGELLARYAAGAPVHSQAVLVGDKILFSDGAGYTWLYPLGDPKVRGTLEKPKEIWKHYAGAPILTQPVFSGETVFVASVDNVIYALDLKNGQSKWRFSNPPDKTRTAELELFGAPPPLVVDNSVLVGFHDGRVVALTAETGEPLWEKKIGEGRYPDIIGAMTVHENTLFVGAFSGPLVAMDLTDQSVKWRADLGTTTAVTLSGMVIYVGGSDGKMRALDRLTGARIWEWDSKTMGALTQPILGPAGLLVGSSDGDLWIVDSEKGTTLWRFDPGWFLDGISAAPAIDGRELWVVTNGGNLISLVVPAETTERALFNKPPWVSPFAPELPKADNKR